MKIKINNFQSLKEVEFEVPVGVTAVTGDSDIGKSSIIRALKSLYIGWSSNGDVRHGESNSSLYVEDDDYSILREKGKKNRYEVVINGEKTELEKVGRNLPDEVEKLGVRKISLENNVVLTPQIQGQHQYIFLLDKFETDVAIALGAISRASIPTKASRLCGKDIKQIGTDIKYKESDLKNVGEKLKAFEGLEDLEASIDLIEKTKKEVVKKEEALGKTKEYISLNRAFEVLDKIKEVNVPDVSEGKDLVDNFSVLCNLVKGLGKYKSEYVGFNKVLSIEVPEGVDEESISKFKELKSLVKLYNSYKYISGLTKEIKEIVGEKDFVSVNKSVEEIKVLKNHFNDFKISKKNVLDVSKEFNQVEEELKTVIDEISEFKVCPTCNKEF